MYHIDLCILKNPCILAINPSWSWHMIFLMYCWIQFANILLRIFASVFIKDIGLLFFIFIFLLFPWLVFINVGFTGCVWKTSLHFRFWKIQKNLRRIGIKSLNILCNSLVKLSPLGLGLLGDFWLLFQSL